jgi:alpha-ketoglutarate-dependent taurine dioxygenase
MSGPAKKPSLRERAPARRPVALSGDELVKREAPPEGATLPLTLRATVAGLDPVEWAAGRREEVESLLLRHGALYFRDFAPMSAADFERFIRGVAGEPLEYGEPTSPRSPVAGRIYTSTDHPASQRIFLHNENSYANDWPMKLFFLCLTPAEAGGETPVADSRRIYRRLAPPLRERFAEKRILYVRNYGGGMGLSWQEVFRTNDRSEVEAFCRAAGYECLWRGDGRLTTRRVGQAVATHPRTGEAVWFNHGAFFHLSTLEPALREALLASVPEEDVPYNTFYGDGSPIEPDALDEVREAYRLETVARPWHAGGVLMLDNMLAAHGRAPFEGPRKVLVGMAEPFSALRRGGPGATQES